MSSADEREREREHEPEPEPEPSTASENTPLLSRDEESHDGNSESTEETSKLSNRLPSFFALGVLSIALVFAIIGGFAAPAAVEEYAKEAVTFRPYNISIDSFTDIGIRARVQGLFWLDGSKVRSKPIRDLGRAATWIAHHVESGDAKVDIHLPEYDNSLLGVVRIPPIVLDIRNEHDNFIDIIADLEPGDVNGLQSLAQDVLDGKRSLKVKAVANVPVRSGLMDLGVQTVTHYMTLKSDRTPKIPDFDINNLRVAEYGLPGHPEGVKATAEVLAMNEYPVKFDVPPLAFEVLLPDCSNDYLTLGTMSTALIHILPEQIVTAAVTGFMHQLPTSLTSPCPGSNKSPLDTFVGAYLAGNKTRIFVRGGQQDPERTPSWIGNILQSATVPVPVPTHPFGNMIKNFSLSDVHLQLPDAFVDPDTPEANPRLSANVNVVVGLPRDINIDVAVDGVRADADVYFRGKKLGELDLDEWQKASSRKLGDELFVSSEVRNAPLRITDSDVFTDVIQSMIFGGKGVELGVKADVDINSATALGQFVVRKIPAKGKIHVKPLGGGNFEHTVKDISVVGSSAEELILEAKVAVKNPTEYSAHVPTVNISVWCNETQLGYAWGSFDVRPGTNDLAVKASFTKSPVGAEFLSQYISGHKVNITLASHPGSVPGVPDPKISLSVPVPHMFGKFLKETTMHILTSTATFILFSPLPMSVTRISADAYYEGTDIGTIAWNSPFDIQVGDNLTPKLPVDWNLDGGYGLIKDALGGQLRLDARADVGVRIGQWEETVWYEAKGMGAKVRL